MASQTADKRNERDREIRHHILQAAQELYLSLGYQGVSMKDIAQQVHVTSAALYYHFPEGKAQLFAEMVRTMLTRWSTAARQAIASCSTLEDRMRALLQVFGAMQQDSIAALMRDAFTKLPTQMLFELFHHGQDVFQEHVIMMFQEAIDAGEIRADISAIQLAQMFQVVMFAPPPILPTMLGRDIGATIIAVLLDGLRPR